MNSSDEDRYPGATGVVFHMKGLKLIQTCAAFPEQYDAIDGRGRQVGYLRLRHGRFYACYPDVGGEVVYEFMWPEEDELGRFRDDDERGMHLFKAVRALREKVRDARR